MFIGDVVGDPGIRSVERALKDVCAEYAPDLIIANGENSTPDGRGLSVSSTARLWDSGVEILTLGNHAWDHRDMIGKLHDDRRIVRPANYPGNPPGYGCTIVRVNGVEVLVVNLLGRAFMADVDCPFQKLDEILAEYAARTSFIFVDFHAETTSEKLALGWDFDGRISALVGTHTHVPTADERVLPKGTGYLTDVGMCGPYNGIIGVNTESVIKKFRTQMPVRFEVETDPAIQFNAALFDLDNHGRCIGVSRIQKTYAR